MMRPIDADALKSWIDCGHLRRPTELCFSELDVIQILDMRPTIDPVKHGRWKYDKPMHIICSHCGAEYAKEIIFMSRNLKWEFPKHCPNCGARMDGEEDEEN